MKEGVPDIKDGGYETVQEVQKALEYELPEDYRERLRAGADDLTKSEREALMCASQLLSRQKLLEKQTDLLADKIEDAEFNSTGQLSRIQKSIEAINTHRKIIETALIASDSNRVADGNETESVVELENKETIVVPEDSGDISEVIESQGVNPDDALVTSEFETLEENVTDSLSPEEQLREKMRQVAVTKGREKAERANIVADPEVDVTETTNDEIEQTASVEQSGSQSDSIATVETAERKKLSSYYKKMSDLESLGTKEYVHAQPEYQNILNAIKKLESLASRKSENIEIDAYVESVSAEHLDNLIKRLSDRVEERHAEYEKTFGPMTELRDAVTPESQPKKSTKKQTGWWNRSHPSFEKSDTKKESSAELSQAQAIIDRLTSDATEIDRVQLNALKDEVIAAAGKDKNEMDALLSKLQTKVHTINDRPTDNKDTYFQLTENFRVKDLGSEEVGNFSESNDSVSMYPDYESVIDWNEGGNGLNNNATSVTETPESEKMSFLGMRLPVAGDISKSREENRTAYIAATSFVEGLKLRRNSARTSAEDKQKIESVLNVAAISTVGFTPEVLRSVQSVVSSFPAEAADVQAVSSEPQAESSEPMKYTPEEAKQMVAAVDRVLEKPASSNETVAKTVDTVATKNEKPKKQGWLLAALGLAGLAAVFAYDEKKDADVLEALRAKNTDLLEKVGVLGETLEGHAEATVQNTKTIDELTSATTEEAMSRNVITQPTDSVESVSAALTQEYDTTFSTMNNPDFPKVPGNEVTIELEKIEPKPLPESIDKEVSDMQSAVESVPALPDYVVEKTDVLWNFALGKIDGVATLPALAEISEDERVNVLAKAVQELRTDTKWQEKVGVVSGNPDLIYPGHVIHTEALNDLMKEIITKDGNT